MSAFSQVLKTLRSLPGVGPKSAQRIAFHLLNRPQQEVFQFTNTINNFIQKTIRCSICGLISEQNPCRICSSVKRNTQLLCLVKSVQDALSIERSKSYYGLYHVLDGFLSPLEHVYENNLNIPTLLQRLQAPNSIVQELIFAFEKSIEAEATIKLVMEKLPHPSKLKFSRMAVGIPTGTGLEYVDPNTIQEAFSHRYSL